MERGKPLGISLLSSSPLMERGKDVIVVKSLWGGGGGGGV